METLANLTLGQICGGSVSIIVVLSIFVQISPIKWNPISSFAKWVGKAMNAELMEDIEQMSKKVDKLSDKIDEEKEDSLKRDMVNTRYQIIRFGNEVSLGEKRTREHWNIILKKIDEYETYCNTHPNFPNNEAIATINLIKEEFSICLKTYDFL